MSNKFLKITYDSTPDIFVIASAFRNLLRRSNLISYEILSKDLDSSLLPTNNEIFFPNDREFVDEEILDILKSRESDRMFKFKKHHEYEHMGKTKKIKYNFNNLGYRGLNFTGNEEFIAIGCSQTFGYSLEEEFTWPEQLGKLLGSRVVNLGMPGDSAQGAIMKAMSYIEQFGKPKIIFALLPYKRSEYFSVKNYFSDSNNIHANAPFNYSPVNWGMNFKKISKSPHLYQEIMPPEQNLFATFTIINIFEKYCKEAGIKFIWTGWEEGFVSNRVQDILKHFSKGFFFENSLNDFTSIRNNCHEEYSDHPLFDHAADLEIKTDNEKITYIKAHKGIHWNLHLAERFYFEHNKAIENILE